jgi:RecG-like helicase
MSDDSIPIGDVQYRCRANVRGRIRSVRVRPWGDNPTLECVLVDETGGITLVFLARRQLAGIRPGTMLRAEGMVGAHQRRLAILNPVYELEATG